MPDPLYNYRAHVIRVLDGDTVDVAVDLGFHIMLGERVRLAGINAPEIHSKDAAEKAAGAKAAAALAEMLPCGDLVTIKTAKADAEQEKFGRWLAQINLADGRDVATVLLQQNLVKPWDGQGKKPI
jgi:micrococcal nuclease